MVRTRDHRYVVSRGNTAVFPDGASLYDLRTDPAESRNLAGRGLPAERELAGLLAAWTAQRRPAPSGSSGSAGAARPQPLSKEDAARLRSLGYLRDGGGD